MPQFCFISLAVVCFCLASSAFCIKALKSFLKGQSTRDVAEVGYGLLVASFLCREFECLFFFFFKVKKNEQKPESFCHFNSSGISRRWEVPDLPLCLFTFLIRIMMMHKCQFSIFAMKRTALIAFMTVAGERQYCPRSQSCLERNRLKTVVSQMPLLAHDLHSSARRQMDMNHVERLMVKSKCQSTSKDPL